MTPQSVKLPVAVTKGLLVITNSEGGCIYFHSFFSKVVSIVIWLCSFSLVVARDMVAGYMVEEAAHLLKAGKQREEETVASQYPTRPNTPQQRSNFLPPGSTSLWHEALAGGL